MLSLWLSLWLSLLLSLWMSLWWCMWSSLSLLASSLFAHPKRKNELLQSKVSSSKIIKLAVGPSSHIFSLSTKIYIKMQIFGLWYLTRRLHSTLFYNEERGQAHKHIDIATYRLNWPVGCILSVLLSVHWTGRINVYSLFYCFYTLEEYLMHFGAA